MHDTLQQLPACSCFTLPPLNHLSLAFAQTTTHSFSSSMLTQVWLQLHIRGSSISSKAVDLQYYQTRSFTDAKETNEKEALALVHGRFYQLLISFSVSIRFGNLYHSTDMSRVFRHQKGYIAHYLWAQWQYVRYQPFAIKTNYSENSEWQMCIHYIPFNNHFQHLNGKRLS